MSLNSEQADNRSLLISELKREPQESQEKLSKEALFELEFVDGSISVALSLLMVEKPPLSSPQLHLKISLIPPIKTTSSYRVKTKTWKCFGQTDR